MTPEGGFADRKEYGETGDDISREEEEPDGIVWEKEPGPPTPLPPPPLALQLPPATPEEYNPADELEPTLPVALGFWAEFGAFLAF